METILSSRPSLRTRQQIIADAMAFEIDDVRARYIRDEGLTEDLAKDHERELKRYLSLCAINPHAHYGMRGPIDNLWHTFLIFSRDYSTFCEKVAGRFIHHVPECEDREKSGPNTYLKFLDDYEDIFGHPAPAQYWPRPALPGVIAECQGCNTCSQPEAVPGDPKLPVHEAHCSECNGCGDSGK